MSSVCRIFEIISTSNRLLSLLSSAVAQNIINIFFPGQTEINIVFECKSMLCRVAVQQYHVNG